jgi:MoaA/NifB/PqqE/SkfB family radical SAM enzyme
MMTMAKQTKFHVLKEHNDGNRHVFFYITYACDARCSYCYVGNALLNSALEMPGEQVKAVLDNLVARHGCTTVTFLGGEPLLHSSIFEIVCHAKKLGLTVILDTNGGKLAAARFDMIVASGVDCLSFSIDSLNPSVNSTLRRHGLLESSVELLGLAKARGVRTRVTAVMTSLNFEELPALLSAFAERKVDIFNIHIFMPQGNGERNPGLALTKSALDSVFDVCMEYARRDSEMELRFPQIWHDSARRLDFAVERGYQGCLAKQNDSWNIWPDGQVVTCPFVQRECVRGRFGQSGDYMEDDGDEGKLIGAADAHHCYWLGLNLQANVYYRDVLKLSPSQTMCPAWKMSSFRIEKS